MSQPLWAVLSLALAAWAAFRVSLRLLPGPVSSIRLALILLLIVAFQLIPVHVVGSLQLLGLLRRFSMFHIAAATLALLLATWFVPRPRNGTDPAIPAREESSRSPMPVFAIASIVLIAATYAAFSGEALLSYPRSWDGVDYRLPLSVRWLQDGSLAIPEGRFWKASLPGNGEILSMLLLGTGWQPLAALMNVPATLLLTLSVFYISSRLGASRTASLLAALLASSIPMVTFQTFSNYVDVLGAAFIMSAVAFYMAALTGSRVRLSLLFISGLACGVAIGAKPTFWISAALFLVLAFAVTIGLPRESRGSPMRRLAVLVLGALTPSVFWIGRAFFTTGNPLFPIAPHFLGMNLFEGTPVKEMTPEDYELNFVRSTWEWLIYPWVESKKRGYNLGTGSGLGALYAAFVPLGVIYGVVSTFLRRERRRIDARLILLFALFIGVIMWWTLLHRLPRFGIPHLAVGCTLSAFLLERLHRVRPRLFAGLWLSALALTCLLSAFIPLSSIAGRVKSGRWARHEIYDVPQMIDRLPAGTTVANLSDSFHNNFALAGKDLTNEVVCYWQIPEEDPVSFLAREGVDYILDMDPDEGRRWNSELIEAGYVLLDPSAYAVPCHAWKRATLPDP